MCLLERVLDYDDHAIRLATTTHRATSNPLRVGGRLRAIHLCEYGAQAMAVHGALRSRDAQSTPAPGMLVALRSVTFDRDYIDELAGELIVNATCLQATSSSLQYEFSVSHADQVIAAGRATVVLRNPDPAQAT
jgi:predicted hotdog family 3-hydroxylacyl-ACP dehydratase